MASPVRARHNAQPDSHIMGWLATYAAFNPEVMVCNNATVRLDAYNELQPDALLRLPEEHGGQATISSDNYIEGAPEIGG